MSGSRVASIVPNNRPRTFHILCKDDRAGRVTGQGSTPCMALCYRVTIHSVLNDAAIVSLLLRNYRNYLFVSLDVTVSSGIIWY